MAREWGYPFNQIPTKIFWPYRGGIYSWGSVCGALPPAISAIALVADTETNAPLINDLMAFYCQFPFPQYQPAGLNLPTTVAESSLCHVSVTKWIQATGYARDTSERSERCGGLTADVTKYTVELLNKMIDGEFVAQYSPAAVVGDCMACHSADSHGKETCTECHGDPHEDGF